jgi:Domain of unknown function (DUF4145)
MAIQITNVAYCPHCGNEAPQRLIHKQRFFKTCWNPKIRKPSENTPWSSFVAECQTCGNILVYDNAGDQTDDRTFSGCDLVYPAKTLISRSIPQKVADAYSEALRVRERSPNAFALLIRRALEIVCADQGVIGKNLAHRIKLLSDRGDLPPVLAEATELLRLIGNIAAHGDEKSAHPLYVRIIDEFFIAIVEYLYISPKKIAEFRKRLEVLQAPRISDAADMLRLLRINPAKRAVVYANMPDDEYGRCVAEVDARVCAVRVLAWLDDGSATLLLDAAYKADFGGDTTAWAALPLRYGPCCSTWVLPESLIAPSKPGTDEWSITECDALEYGVEP